MAYTEGKLPLHGEGASANMHPVAQTASYRDCHQVRDHRILLESLVMPYAP